MRVVQVAGTTLLVLGVLMGLSKGFVEYLPYSLYYGVIVAGIVTFGFYKINKLDKTGNEKDVKDNTNKQEKNDD